MNPPKAPRRERRCQKTSSRPTRAAPHLRLDHRGRVRDVRPAARHGQHVGGWLDRVRVPSHGRRRAGRPSGLSPNTRQHHDAAKCRSHLHGCQAQRARAPSRGPREPAHQRRAAADVGAVPPPLEAARVLPHARRRYLPPALPPPPRYVRTSPLETNKTIAKNFCQKQHFFDATRPSLTDQTFPPCLTTRRPRGVAAHRRAARELDRHPPTALGPAVQRPGGPG